MDQIQLVSPTHSCSIVYFFLFHSVVRCNGKLNIQQVRIFLFYFVFYYIAVRSTGPDQGICLYLKIPENIAHHILQERFWVKHVPFVGMVKFKFLAQFLVDHLSHPIISSLINFLANLLHSLIIWFNIIIVTLFRNFQTWFCQWFLTGFWVTASLLKSSWFFSVFWPISIRL